MTNTANTVTASNGVTLANVAPRILPDLSQDKSAAAKPAKPGKPAAKGIAAKHAANIAAASDKVRRISRVAPICNVIVKMMDKGAQHVAIMAKKAECSERDVRLAIDKLRAMKWQIVNKPDGKPKTFGYRKGWKRPAKLAL